jgi:hypothetical protein
MRAHKFRHNYYNEYDKKYIMLQLYKYYKENLMQKYQVLHSWA